MSKLQSQSTSNTASMVQKASIAALTSSQECVAEMRADYLKLRDQVLAGFKTIPGLTCTVPQGAFYVYPNVSAFIGKGGIKSAADLKGVYPRLPSFLIFDEAMRLQGAPLSANSGQAGGVQGAKTAKYKYYWSKDQSAEIDKGVERMRAYFAKLG